MMDRRRFLSLTAATTASAAASWAAPTTASSLPIGMNTYSIRAMRWDDLKLLDYAASQHLDSIFLQDSVDPATMEPAHWDAVKHKAQELGLTLETGGGGVLPKTPDAFQSSVDGILKNAKRAKAMGSKLVRCVGTAQRSALPPGPVEQHMETMAKLFSTVRPQLVDMGLKIAWEIHKDFLSWEFKQVVDAVGKDALGIYLDTGNPVFVQEHPMTAVETLAPYAVCVHLRDSVVYERPDGIAVQWVPLGEGIIDFHEILAKVVELNPNPNLNVHIKPITGRVPTVLPVYDEAYWKNYRDARAGDFSRFLALAKKGKPYDKYMLIEDAPGKPAELTPLIQAQQKEHLERSIKYAKDELKLGRRWKS